MVQHNACTCHSVPTIVLHPFRLQNSYFANLLLIRFASFYYQMLFVSNKRTSYCTGVGDPGMAKLEQVIRGIKSNQARQRKLSSPRLPITPELLLSINGVWERESLARDKAMLSAAAVLCCFFFFVIGGSVHPSSKGL